MHQAITAAPVFEDRPTRMKTRKPGEIAGLSLFQATSRAACVFGLMPII
ncbi:hypothetical protein C032_01340 [Brucella abortus 63/294]|uniref:Uncharacterized protein n=1 Tax=Brucella suis (strain ATCC 23445 / NCTC 10510) TaxID=470137 RepID=B0CHN6_BRUSI|nr:Hypothetical protein BSUIS_A1502 [Brucella suis ATCC 23445]ENR68057.1 hypothetical protein C032_01340 [Brucella abortus 63/294]ENS13195.1 hypothetical protein C980_00818 [Brucella abortus 88/217]ERU08303.1 hypothetical protein P039_00825 [Brucella abortus 07-0994-2411]